MIMSVVLNGMEPFQLNDHMVKNRSAMRTCGGLIISNLILLFCEFI